MIDTAELVPRPGPARRRPLPRAPHPGPPIPTAPGPRQPGSQRLIQHHPYPTHGRILQITLSGEGPQRLEAANPAVRALEAVIGQDLTADEIAAVKAWLVTTAKRLERIARSRDTIG